MRRIRQNPHEDQSAIPYLWIEPAKFRILRLKKPTESTPAQVVPGQHVSVSNKCRFVRCRMLLAPWRGQVDTRKTFRRTFFSVRAKSSLSKCLNRACGSSKRFSAKVKALQRVVRSRTAQPAVQDRSLAGLCLALLANTHKGSKLLFCRLGRGANALWQNCWGMSHGRTLMWPIETKSKRVSCTSLECAPYTCACPAQGACARTAGHSVVLCTVQSNLD